MQYAMFLVMRDIRGKSPEELAVALRSRLDSESETFATNDGFRLHGMNGRQIHRLLARMTDFIETRSGLPSHYADYAKRGAKGRSRSSTSGLITRTVIPMSSVIRVNSPSIAIASATYSYSRRASTPAMAIWLSSRSLCTTTARIYLRAVCTRTDTSTTPASSGSLNRPDLHSSHTRRSGRLTSMNDSASIGS